MLMQRLVLALALLLSGCAQFHLVPLLPFPSPALEGQEQASWIVWHGVYRREDMPPKVHWVQGGDLVCDADSGRRGFETPIGCREGWTLSSLVVSVAWRPDDFFATTALGHELLHAKFLREGVLLGDPNHQRPEWEPGGLKDKAVGALEEAGL